MKYPNTFKDWQHYAGEIDRRAKALQGHIHDRGWAIAAAAGIPHCGCCLHNASIDDDLRAWCKNNPARLKAAKRASHIVDDWSVSRLADRITGRAWERLQNLRPFVPLS